MTDPDPNILKSAAVEKTQKGSVAYQVPEPPSALVREEEFAEQLRLARYLAASSLPPVRALEPQLEARTPKQARGVKKTTPKAKAESAKQKTRESELAKERRRAGRVTRQKAPSSAPHRGEKQRDGPSR